VWLALAEHLAGLAGQYLAAAVDGGADVGVLERLDAEPVGNRLHLRDLVGVAVGDDDVDPHRQMRLVGGGESPHKPAERSPAAGHPVERLLRRPVQAQRQPVRPGDRSRSRILGGSSRDPLEEIWIIIPMSHAAAWVSGNSGSISGSPPVNWSHSTPASAITCSSRSRPGQSMPANSFSPR